MAKRQSAKKLAEIEARVIATYEWHRTFRTCAICLTLLGFGGMLTYAFVRLSEKPGWLQLSLAIVGA